MNPPLTQKLLIDWAGQEVLKEAETLVEKGLVLDAHYNYPTISGSILYNNRPLKTGLTILSSGLVENHCPCYANRERGLVCAHAVALGVTVVRRATDPLREAKYKEELRRASRLAQIDETDYLQRAPFGTPGAFPAQLRLTLAADWQEGFRQGAVGLRADLVYRQQAVALDEAPRRTPFAFDHRDESLLYVLEDISEGPARGTLALNRADFLNVIRLHIGGAIRAADGRAVAVRDTRVKTSLVMDLDRTSGELRLLALTPLPPPECADPEQTLYLVSGNEGWLFAAGQFWPLAGVLPRPYHAIYECPITVARPDVIRFLKQELPTLMRQATVETAITPDLFTVDPALPKFRLAIQGSPASLAATLFARYGELELVANKPDAREHFAIPDPTDLLRYTARNPAAERAALEAAARCGLRGEVGDALTDVVGKREVLNFLGASLPALRRAGWLVDMQGRIQPYMEQMPFATPVVHVTDSADGRWFDVGFDFEYGEGVSLSPQEVQQALLLGNAFVERNGRAVLVDAGAVESMRDVFADCATGEAEQAGHFRMSNLYAPFVKSSLDALDGVDVEAAPTWRARCAEENRELRVEPVPLPAHLEHTLRPYQRDGVNWLRFLERNGFCGILADEMGLGKTLQALVWLGLVRTDAAAQGKPALIVCPTSLVQNWAEEAARFTPDLKVVCLTGSDRHDRWEEAAGANLVVTSYALLRRDLERYLEIEFAAAVLDEAQHIKNRATQNAQAAKQIRAVHRLVLTGTPVENSVTDLWSIMDFLMPGYMGAPAAFRLGYELPIGRGGPDAQVAQVKLRRKLHPFLLRRLKRDVAKELPPKIEKVSYCELTPDQKVVYGELLKSSQRRLTALVAQQGFGLSRMEILTTLLRLRQACCHLDLLKLPNLKAEAPSGKLDLFLELLAEAVDGGHRVLVFSQFVTMLQILRGVLDDNGLTYCYLDGSTVNRMDEVHRFNRTPEIPLFLISLKAGGTGLNLTGADMVVHFDPWWNPAVENQATDRAYRIGQQRTVYAHKLITRGTVEEKVLELQQRKKAVIDATVDGDERVMQSLTWEDVQELLKL